MKPTTKPLTTSPQTELDRLLASIAKEMLFIETLEKQNMDSLDFHEVGVDCLKDALLAAYQAGVASGKKKAR